MSMPRVELEPKVLPLEGASIFYALDRAASLTHVKYAHGNKQNVSKRALQWYSKCFEL
jgi:hypothetical protein